MSRSSSSSTFPELQKYARKRQLFARSGFFLEIHVNGVVSSTKDKLSPYAKLQFLSVGPNLIAIWGSEAKRYLAIGDSGNIFTTESEKKECVLREYLGKNFFSLFRTCHSDQKGRGWYLSIDQEGNVSSDKVEFSDQPRLHFIVKTVPEIKGEEKQISEAKFHNPSFQVLESEGSVKCNYHRWPQNSFQRDRGILDFNSFTPSPQSSSVVSRSSGSYSWSGSIEFSLSSDTV